MAAAQVSRIDDCGTGWIQFRGKRIGASQSYGYLSGNPFYGALPFAENGLGCRCRHREVTRLGTARDDCIARAVHGNARAAINVTPAQVRGVDQSIAGRAQFQHESVGAQLLVVAPGRRRPQCRVRH